VIVSAPCSPQGEAVFAALKAVSDINGATQTLILVDDPAFDENAPTRTLGNAVIVNIARLVDGLSIDQRYLVAYRLVEIVAKGARLHLAADEMSARFLGRYGRLLADRDKVFYRADDQPQLFRGIRMIEATPFDFLSEFLDDATLVIHSSRTGQAHDRARLDRRSSIWRVAYLPVELDVQRASPTQLSHRALAIGLKGPETRQLQQLCAASALNLVIDTAVPGQTGCELANFDVVLVMDEAHANYRELITFLQAGLPIIGAPVEPLSEIMEKGNVCLEASAPGGAKLVSSKDCLMAFYRDGALRERLTLGIREFLGAHHSLASHRSCIADLLEVPADRNAASGGLAGHSLNEDQRH
jgi:hypothetical protein